MNVFIGRRMLAVLVVAGLAGCGSPASEDVRSESPYVLDGCVRRDEGRLFELPSGDGANETKGVVLGEGSRAVILAPDRDANVCQWLAYGQSLVLRGFRVALYDYNRNVPEEEQLTAVAAAVREDGAQRIVLVGAGDGANASLICAARIRPVVNGVVALSPPRRIEGQAPVEPSVRALRMPLLLVTAVQDPGGASATVPAYQKASSGRAQVVLVDGRSSGTELLAGAEGDKVRSAVEAFLGRT